MTIHYRQHGSAIIIFGNTYPFRDQIKALGGRFNGGEKTWRIPLSESALTTVATLCSDAGGGVLGATSVPTSRLEPERTASVIASLFPDLPAEVPTAVAVEVKADTSLTIRQLMDRLSQAVTMAFPVALWVTGEVQNLTRRASGIFFDLAEGRAGTHANATVTARAIIWSGSLQAMEGRHGKERLGEVLEDGMQVRCLCQVQLYKDRGSITLLIDDVDPAYTKGALALAREKLLKELRAKGLDQANKRLRLPVFPFRVGLITAAGSRAMSDFLDQLHGARFPGEVVVCATPMQGEGVPLAVARALALLAEAGCDLIVLTRGGGSAADLRWFDAAEIAYAIAHSPVPVIAAIGHHDDVCVAEEICHLRQKTPTAAADFVAGCFDRARELTQGLATTLATVLARRVEDLGLKTAAQAERLAHGATQALTARVGRLTAAEHGLERGATDRLGRSRELLDASEHRLQLGAAGSLSRGRERLEAGEHALQRSAIQQLGERTQTLAGTRATLALAAERALAALGARLAEAQTVLAGHDPKLWLRLGWTQLMGARGRVRRAEDVTIGEPLTARLADGWLALTVTGTTRPGEETQRE